VLIEKNSEIFSQLEVNYGQMILSLNDVISAITLDHYFT